MSLTLTLKDNGGNPVSGEGTSITLNNTTETNFTKFDLYGDTEQQTYTGKNLLNITKGTFTQNGITFTQNPDGSVTMNGTSTGNAYYEMNNTAASQTTITSGVRYTLSIGNVTLPAGQVIVQIRKVNPNTIYAAVSDKSASFTAPETTTTFTYIGVYGSGVTLNNLTIYPMIEVGSSMTSFEPYVGGTASPNPDYPQEVQTVTGEQTITVSNGQGGGQVYPINLGKNILNNTGTTTTAAGGITFTVNADKSVTVSGVSTSACWFKLSESMQLDGDYFLSGCPSGGSTTTFSLQTSYSGTVFDDYGSGVQLHAGTTDPVWIVVRSGQDFSTPATFYPQIEKGTSQSSYAPYIQAFGKNLLNLSTLTADGRLNADGTVLSGATGFSTSDYIPVEPNATYTITRNAASSGFFGNLCQYNSNKTKIGNREYWDNSTTWPYHTTTSEDTHYIRVSDQTTLFGTSFQIEKGSSATTYEPNISGQLELCEIGDYQDYLYKSEGNWYVHKEIGKSLIDGTQGTVQRITTNRFNVSGFPTGYKMQKLANFSLADKYQTVVQYDTNGDFDSGTSSMNYAFGFHPTSSGVRIKDTRYNTVDDYKTWLATNPIIVYYALANQTDIQITYEPLVAQLESIYNTAHSYNGATIITSSSQYLPAIMDVTVGGSTNEVTYTETEISNPLTITDIEGKSQNTTLNGNIYVDYVYNKKSFSVSIFNLKSADYATIRGFYDRQFTLNEFPLLSIPELNISEMPVFFEIGSREINSQCIVTDKLTLKFRETAQQ